MVTSRILFTAKQKDELWERWKNGQSVLAISRALERRNKTGVQRIVALNGGIAPAREKRSIVVAHHGAGAGHKIYPYLLRGGDHAVERGVGDGHHLHPDGARLRLSGCCARWLSRRVLSWRLSITMEAAFCVEALEDALARHGKPEIFNTIRAASSPARLHWRADQKRDRDQHGRQGRLAGQRVRRAAVAQHQIRGGVSAGLRQRQRGPRFDRPLPDFYNGRRPTRALTA